MAKSNSPIDASQLAALVPTATVHVVLAYKKSPTEWDFRRVPLYGEAPNAFRQRILESATDLRDNRAERSYDPEWVLTSDQYSVLEIGDPPLGGNFFTQLPYFSDFQAFEEKKRVRSHRSGWWLLNLTMERSHTSGLGLPHAPFLIRRGDCCG